MLCPHCDTDPSTDPVIEAAQRRHAELAAEDSEGFGSAA
jgi:hypothetical protein